MNRSRFCPSANSIYLSRSSAVCHRLGFVFPRRGSLELSAYVSGLDIFHVAFEACVNALRGKKGEERQEMLSKKGPKAFPHQKPVGPDLKPDQCSLEKGFVFQTCFFPGAHQLHLVVYEKKTKGTVKMFTQCPN